MSGNGPDSAPKITRAVVIGSSAGGLDALNVVLATLPASFAWPVIIAQHAGPQAPSSLAELLGARIALRVKEAEEKEAIQFGWVYLAPPNYHLLVERDFTFSLAASDRVNFARPSVDVLFESAAEAYRSRLIGIILTGANSDGSRGLKRVKELGGMTIVQDPLTAYAAAMPLAAIREAEPAYVLPLQEVGPRLVAMLAQEKLGIDFW